jgi:ribosomal protein L11 methyltransferase
MIAGGHSGNVHDGGEATGWPPNLILDVSERELDDAVGRVWSLDPVAVAEESLTGGGTRLVVGFVDEVAARVASTALQGRWSARLEPVEDDSWQDMWRADAATSRVGPLVVHPAWLPVPELGADEVLVLIDPARTFGTGAHPATRLALGGLIHAVRPGNAVLDVGCGSGVLAVAAARLGAARVVAIDLDQAAVDATRTNADRNHVAGTVEARTSSVNGVEGLFDVVVANLGGNRIVVELAAAIAGRVRPGGVVIISGLLADRWEPAAEPMVAAVAAATGGEPTVRTMAEGDWAALVVSVPGGGPSRGGAG